MSSLWALPCPLPGVSDLLKGAHALPSPSSHGNVTVADLVKPRAKFKNCGNNTYCCSNKGVALAQGGGGALKERDVWWCNFVAEIRVSVPLLTIAACLSRDPNIRRQPHGSLAPASQNSPPAPRLLCTSYRVHGAA